MRAYDWTKLFLERDKSLTEFDDKEFGDILEVGSKFMRGYEIAKRSFGDESTVREPLHLVMQHAPHNGYNAGRVTISDEDMKNCFDPVLDNMWELLEHEIIGATMVNKKTVVKEIIFVGGLAECSYVRKVATERFREAGIVVRIPPKPRLAVVKGAVLTEIDKYISQTQN
ncbi:hypothetical protein BJX70DRAFT_401130 [Aspergillus crustosus]